MKSEPDRLDLLIVALPLVLLAVLGVQVYRFVQMSQERAPGVALAEEVIAAPTSPDVGATEAPAASDVPGAPAPAGPAEGGGEPTAGGPASPPVLAPEPAGPAPQTGVPAPEAPPEAAPGPAPAAPDRPPAAPPAQATARPAPANIVVSPDPATSGAVAPAPAAGITPAGEAGLASGSEAGSRSSEAAGPAPAGGVPIVALPGAEADDFAAEPSEPADAADGGEPAAAPRRSLSSAVPGEPGDAQPVDPKQPARVSAVPAANPVSVGQIVPVHIFIENAANVASVPFHLHFNPAVLRLDDSRGEKGSFLAVSGVSTQFLAAPGPRGGEAIVGISLMGSPVGVSGAGLLATIHLQAIAPGESKLVFSHSTVRKPDAGIVPATFLPSTVTVVE
jgi:hypothetical protein